MIELNEENKKLFGEQVNDHVEKLNDMMGLTLGETFENRMFRKGCLATKLLEGSTRMLGLLDWSSALERFRKLIEACSTSGRCWDDQLSQIVSEILETEERILAEILTGEVDGIDLKEAFGGLRAEIDALLGELVPGNGDEAVSSLQFEPVPVKSVEEPDNHPESPSALDMLIESLSSLREKFGEYFEGRDQGADVIKSLEAAFGESEFFIGLVGDILRRLGGVNKPFLSKVSSNAVLEGVRDFFCLLGKLRKWDAKLETRSDDFTLDREAASTLALILENCLFDICRMYEEKRLDLDIKVDISNEGSYLLARISDNGPDFLSDSEIDGCDAVAYYKGLLCIRSLLERWGGLLRVEPDRGQAGRFHFTLPHMTSMTRYYVFDSSGKSLAVPCHCTDTVLELERREIACHANGRYIVLSGTKVPVYGLDELASEEIEGTGDGDHLVVIGLAEKRVGIFSSGPVQTIDGVSDQLTEGSWAALTRHYLHIGDEEYPVLNVLAVLSKTDYLLELQDSFEESGSFAGGEEVAGINEELAVPRV